ncbi:MAG: prephenate dehydrogenase/arogenate dehydrogenase family protein [Odoribacteraceae bacterium]|jgi:prephenate dehydrogenase|nr:prephenate dehydrogenase/arogenate dehydrogenase family protein [Odoribacteraceae bacterium]
MRIQILGAGKMGAFFADALGVEHEVAIHDYRPERLRFTYNCIRMRDPREIAEFNPEILLNAATLKYTVDAFRQALPYLSPSCILADVASVKTGLKEFYEEAGHPFVSTHPMFGPTFANLENLASENAIIITESAHMGKVFFRDLYSSLKLKIFEYSFDEHDRTIAYSLSIPFASTLVFAAVMKPQEAPGTTFKKHMNIARGLLSEDDYLLSEILFNPRTTGQLEQIRQELARLVEIIEAHDAAAMKEFLRVIRQKIVPRS